MQTTRRTVLAAAAGVAAARAQPTIMKYVRFRKGAATAYGILEGDTIREIRGDLFGDRKPAAAKHKLSEVKLLYPCTPPKVLAVGLNYKSHLGARTRPLDATRRNPVKACVPEASMLALRCRQPDSGANDV